MRIIQLTEYQGKESSQRQEGNMIKPRKDFTGEIPWVCTTLLGVTIEDILTIAIVLQ